MSGHDIVLTLDGPVALFGKREAIEELADEMMAHMVACDVVDPSVSESYDEAEEHVRLEIELSVKQADPARAVEFAMTTIRSALSAGNVGTPGWEEMIQQMRHEVRASSDDDLLATT